MRLLQGKRYECHPENSEGSHTNTDDLAKPDFSHPREILRDLPSGQY